MWLPSFPSTWPSGASVVLSALPFPSVVPTGVSLVSLTSPTPFAEVPSVRVSRPLHPPLTPVPSMTPTFSRWIPRPWSVTPTVPLPQTQGLPVPAWPFSSPMATRACIDLGAALGAGTNNLGEVYAVGLCLQTLLQCFPMYRFHDVAVFTDSKYTLQVLSSRSSPTSNAHTVRAVRSLLRDCAGSFTVSLRWLKGHAGIPGNALADSIAGHCSSLSPTASPLEPITYGSIGLAPASILPTLVTTFFAFYPGSGPPASLPSIHVNLASFTRFSVLPPSLASVAHTPPAPRGTPFVGGLHPRRGKRPSGGSASSPPRCTRSCTQPPVVASDRGSIVGSSVVSPSPPTHTAH